MSQGYEQTPVRPLEAMLPWSFAREVPLATRAEGVYLYDENGRRYLDGSGGAVAVTIGHAVPAVTERIAQALAVLPYAHTSHFRSPAAESLAAHLAAKFPAPDANARVIFTSGGSEATETALKLARCHWICRGEQTRTKVVSRWHSYHGATFGALGVSGHLRRRRPYADQLPRSYHAPACFCYHCPLGRTYPTCDLACASGVEEAIRDAGPDTVAAFILEPIVGATSGAVPPPGYLSRVREICDRYGVLLIADEIMTGAGRTGRYYAVEHWGVEPDIILMGKGLSSGYAPLGAVIASQRVWEPLREARASLEHSFTYQAHPVSAAAGLAVQEHLDAHHLVARARQLGPVLETELSRLLRSPMVGDIRGMGLLWTIEIVADRASRTPFDPSLEVSERLYRAIRQRGVLVYPARGTADGTAGDHLLIAPPFIITPEQIAQLVEAIEHAVDEVANRLET